MASATAERVQSRSSFASAAGGFVSTASPPADSDRGDRRHAGRAAGRTQDASRAKTVKTH